VLGVPAIPSTIMALNLGRFRARFGAGPILVFGSLAIGLGFAVLAVAPTLPLLMLGPVIYGFGEGLMIPTLQDAVASAAPASSRGAIVASFVGVNRLGQTVGPVAAGAGLAAFGSEAVFLVGAVMAVAMAVGYPVVRARSRQEIAAVPANPVP
jgi:MFS family permease